ncbi:HDOD domain-containing protein [Aquincola sp. S2]|uniref:HDOD domain-containing protein n=1 Tax=Pseudaquabacterium terrae TaxID=2732868 RepID=A0ABX2EN70_9BURK|nr:HDOD domain-containing protein [Aquabacterium terrae]NRF69939.1 HDOD domain-containing protein [Aquabacterium terrae]
MPASTTAPPSASRSQAVRHFGRFQLLQLVGKSARTMLWQVADPRNGQELVLAMPRNRPTEPEALERWRQAARKASRIDHPSLAHVVEVGEVEQWPYITYDRGNSATLAELLTTKGQPALEIVPRALQALQGLAFAHEAGASHQDLQLSMLLIGESGPCRVMGLGVAMAPLDAGAVPSSLQAHRIAAERDVLAFGIVLHHALSGQPALEQADVAAVIERLPAQGREIVRLPWSTAHPIPEALRAIVNRSTDRQERQRYRNARTLEHALEGWLSTQAGQGGGPLAQLNDRMRANGALPSVPGGAARAARLALMERERTNELAEIVLQDTALAFEMLRMVNSAQVRAAMAAGSGPVLTVRRSIAMLGLDGVRRAALSLRAWPGPLNETQAADFDRLLERVRRAARIAQWLRPAGYDAEVVYLLALLQNLGRLIVHYHFPDEAQQIRRLMQPAPAAKAGEPDEPGMTEEGAAFAVLGTDVESLGAAVARQWGLDDTVMHMIRRVAATSPVRSAETDDEVLRLAACCANEVVDVGGLPAPQQANGLQRVAQRYARVLGISLRDVQLAAQGIAPGSDEDVAGRASQLGGLH